MKLTLEEAVWFHRKLWTYIAEHMDECFDFIGDSRKLGCEKRNYLFSCWKKEAIRKLGITDYVLNNCFLCEYVNNIPHPLASIGCDFCPLVRDQKKQCLDNLYNTVRYYIYNKHFYCAVITALEIRDLPIVNRKGERYEKEK